MRKALLIGTAALAVAAAPAFAQKKPATTPKPAAAAKEQPGSD